MVTNGESNPMRTALLIGLGAFILTILFVLWRYGAKGVWTIIKMLALWSLILFAIFGIVMLAIWLFQKKKIDMVEVHKKRIVEACRLNESPYKQTLSMRAFGDDFAERKLGSVIGVCAILAEPDKEQSIERGKVTYKAVQEKYRTMMFVAYRPPGFINWMLGEKKVFGGLRQDFGVLSADIIYINGMTMAPSLYEINFLWHHWEQRAFIDETIKGNIYRYTLQENLKELAGIMEDAVDVSSKHVKDKETRNVQQIPIQAIQPPQTR